jgi:chitin synthase
VVVIVDGYENIPSSFKEVAREKGFLDEEVLFQKGFMDLDRDGNFKMKNMRDVVNEGVPAEKIPTNILHVF